MFLIWKIRNYLKRLFFSSDSLEMGQLKKAYYPKEVPIYILPNPRGNRRKSL